MAKIWTDAQAAKLQECEIRKPGGGSTKRKFVRRGRKYVVTLLNIHPFKDSWIECSRLAEDVYMNGQQLKYIPKYEFHSSKSPF